MNNLLVLFLFLVSKSCVTYSLTNKQPLANIAIHKAVIDIQESASITIESRQHTCEDTLQITVRVVSAEPSNDDWVGVFSPANFNASDCFNESDDFIHWQEAPYLCTAPLKYKFVNYSSPDYVRRRRGSLRFQIINQRADFAFALFTGGLYNPKLIRYTHPISFENPKAPLYPRLAQGKSWNQMAVTWTSGYNVDEADPFVEYSLTRQGRSLSHAGTLTFSRSSMCGPPASTVGWRDPGFIHTSFLNNLRANTMYDYRMGHRLVNGSIVWSQRYRFKSSPNPGQDSLQRVIIFGNMGKAERDGSHEYNDDQPGALMTTNQLKNDLKNFDIVFHIGNLAFAEGYISQWDQFTAQIQSIASRKPYMTASGHYERDFPHSGSLFGDSDSGGECGVPAETMFYVPAKNRAKPWYTADYGMLRFCIADSELDWDEGSEQYEWMENCFASVDRQEQPWLIFAANAALGYYNNQDSFNESIQKLWQKYKVDIAFSGDSRNYKRTCPVYENECVSRDEYNYMRSMMGTIHIVVGGAGSQVDNFADINPDWTLYTDTDFGYGKLTAFNHSSLLFEYMKSRDGNVYDSFTISRD
ncbi:putative inactive purple acid phosphatase 27 [Bidens hawaiensis]|uniref:putative inactive purple acid phosphatase 27 n=1 Tax=Bidens hawaiensis TaxID=980011 RepID=UPI00404B2D91